MRWIRSEEEEEGEKVTSLFENVKGGDVVYC